MRVHEPYNLYWPKKYANALRLLFDPERMQLAGFSNNKPRNIIYDYSKGGVIYRNLFPIIKYNEAGVLADYSFSSNNWHIDRDKIILDTGITTAWGQLANNVVTRTPLSGGKMLHIKFKQRVTSEYYAVDRVCVRFIDDSNNYIDKTTYVIDGWDNNLSFNGWHRSNWNNPNDGDLFDFYIKTIPEGAKYVSLSVGHDHYEDTNHEKYYIYDLEIEEVIDNGNHGLANGELEKTGWGQHAAAIRLDGVNDFIDFGNVCDTGSNDFIVFSWLYNVGSGYIENVLTKQTSDISSTPGTPGWIFRIRNTDEIALYWNQGNGGKQVMSTGSPVAVNGWNLSAAVVKNGEFLKFYNNDTEVPGYNSSSYISGSLGNSASFQVGAGNSSLLFRNKLGISGAFIFDGQGGAPSQLPEDYEDIIHDIWNQTKSKYGL